MYNITLGSLEAAHGSLIHGRPIHHIHIRVPAAPRQQHAHRDRVIYNCSPGSALADTEHTKMDLVSAILGLVPGTKPAM